MSEIHEDIMPVGYVTKNELTKLRLGASCVDLFGQVVPKGFEMVPLYSAPVSLSSELDRLREENERLRIDEDRYRAFIRDVQMLAYKWQEAHDCLKAGLPYSFPSPSDLPECEAENARLREALQKAETVIDLMADVVTYDATMQGPKILGVNGSAARRASEAARNYFITKDRVKP